MKAIAAKLTKIMQACAYVQKTGKNTFHGYKYATAADVLDKANEAMVENNVCCFVTPKLIEFRDVLTAKGATEHLATVEATVTLVDSESGESITLVGLGSGQDSGDKAIMKAQTAALKYSWMMSLNIATGDDPEADESTDRNNAKSPTANTNTCSGGNIPQDKNKAATGQAGGKKEDANKPIQFKKKCEDGSFVFVANIAELTNRQIEWYARQSANAEQQKVASDYILNNLERFPNEKPAEGQDAGSAQQVNP